MPDAIVVARGPANVRLRFKPGIQGTAGSVAVGATTTGLPGTQAAVVNSGSASAAVLDFTIPRGDQGIQGPKGDTGNTGPQGPSGSVTDGDKGDIVVSGSGAAWTVDADAIDNTKLSNMATSRIKGRATAGTGDPEDLTGAQATALMNAFTGDSGSGGVKGLVPSPAAGDTAAGKVLGAAGSWITPSSQPAGQCRLVKSGANIVLQPFNGNALTINGANQTIPSAGVSLAPTGLTVSTLYYVYAYMSGATMTLEASATARATDTSTGLQIKSGDATRTLVGMVRPITGPAFADTAAQRFVISWFNTLAIAGAGAFSTNRQVTATTAAEINSEIRVEFLTWSIRNVRANVGGGWEVLGAAAGYAQIVYDGTTSALQITQTSNTATTALALFSEDTLTDGYHYATLFGYRSGGTSIQFRGTGSGTDAVRLFVNIQG